MTSPAFKEQDNDADKEPVKKSAKILEKRLRPVEKQLGKVEEIEPVSTIVTRRNAKR